MLRNEEDDDEGRLAAASSQCNAMLLLCLCGGREWIGGEIIRGYVQMKEVFPGSVRMPLVS